MSMPVHKETYSVASNPVIAPSAMASIRVLFSGESQTKPGHRLGPKVYEFYLMHIILSGKGAFSLDGHKYELGAGCTFLIKPGQLISYESDNEDPWRYRWVAFKGEPSPELVSLAGFEGTKGQSITLSDIRKASILYHHIYSAFKRGGSAAALQAAGYLQLLMAVYKEASIRGDSIAGGLERGNEQLHLRVVHYLSSQFTHPVSIEGMAESLGYNRAYLSRMFKQKTGMSPISFLLKLRLDRAKLMLRERPELTVEQIAASVGLQDGLYFSKQFRKQHGLSPTAYRKEMSWNHTEF